MNSTVTTTPPLDSRELQNSIRRAVEASSGQSLKQISELRKRLDAYARAERPQIITVDTALKLPAPQRGAIAMTVIERDLYGADGTEWFLVGGGGGGGGMLVHDIAGAYHTGTITEAQAPWAATKTELEELELDISHPRLHEMFDPLDHFAVGNKWQIGGLTAIDTWGKLTPLSDTSGVTAEAILKSDTTGALRLTKLRAPLIDTGTTDLELRPFVDLELNPGSGLIKLLPDTFIQSSNYASQLTGVRVSWAGEGDFRYIYVDEMHAKSFIADLEQALAGGQIITKSVTALASDFVAPAAGAATTLHVKDLPSAINMQVFQEGDIIRVRQFSRAGGALAIANCWGVVTAYVDGDEEDVDEGTQYWTFTRSVAPNAGLMAPLVVINKDAIVLDYGTDGNGFYEVNAIDGINAANSPYLQFVRWIGHPATGQQLRLRAGQLRGIFGNDEFGLFVGTGTDDTDRYIHLSDDPSQNGMHNLPIRMFNTEVNTGVWEPDGSLHLSVTGVATETERDFTFDTTNSTARIGRSITNWPNLFYSKTGGYVAMRNGTDDKIRFNSDGSSYFAGIMTIGTLGEIQQGTGLISASTFTGLRIFSTAVAGGRVGQIAGYKLNVLQWSADTNGELRAGAGLVGMSSQGLGFSRDTLELGTASTSTNSQRAVAWWDNIDARTGSPIVRIYGGRTSAGTGSVPHLVIDVDPANADGNSRPAIWLIGKGALPTRIWFNYIHQFVGMPGLALNRNPVTFAESIDISGTITFKGHLLRDPSVTAIDIGTAGNPYRTLYANTVIATSISGTSMSGSEWEYTGNMLIDATSASNTTVTISNSGTGAADLSVDRNIIVGGTVDGVDILSFKGLYDAHVLNANAHHAQAHAYDSADHTGTLSWAKVNKAGSNLDDIVTRNYIDLQNRDHDIIGVDHTINGVVFQLVGATATDVLGLLTPSSSPGVNDAILRTNSAGALILDTLTVSTNLYVNGYLDFGTDRVTEDVDYLRFSGTKPVRFGQDVGMPNWTIFTTGQSEFFGTMEIKGTGNLYVAGSVGGAAGVMQTLNNRVGILCVPDPQFALDVAGPVRAQYFIGPHAIQLKNALLIAHFDGPERGPIGEPNGHFGQVPTITGDVLHRLGKFNKALEISDAVANQITNPSLETNTTGWTNYSNGDAAGTRLRTDLEAWDGEWSYQLVKTGGTNGSRWGTRLSFPVTIGSNYSANVRVKVAAATNVTGSLVFLHSETNVTIVNDVISTVDGEWVEMALTCQATATGSANIYIWIANCDTATVYVDAVQVTASFAQRPFWGGASPRAAAVFTYNNLSINWSRCTVMCWFRTEDLATSIGRRLRLFELYADGSNRFNVLIEEGTERLEAFVVGNAVSASLIGSTAVVPREWNHAAIVIDDREARLYLNGKEEDIITFPNIIEGVATAYIGAFSGVERINGMIDDFAIVNEAMSAKAIQAVYESNAPVFAESSVWSWRATPNGLVWADENGLWMRDFAGNSVFGIYGAEAVNYNWGGKLMNTGDLMIGRGSTDYVFWDNSAGTMTFAGVGSDVTDIDGGNITTRTITGDQIKLTSYLAIGATQTFGSTGIQLIYNAGFPLFYAGNGSTKYFKYDGVDISWAGVNTSLTASGTFTANNAVIRGTITALTGRIGGDNGWLISTGTISSTNVQMISGLAGTARLDLGVVGMSTHNSPASVVFWGGTTWDNRDAAPIRIYENGNVIATGMTAFNLSIQGNSQVSGYLYAGGNNITGTVRLSTDGQRMKIANNQTIADIPNSSSAIRWLPDINGTITSASNYTGMISYRHTAYQVVDLTFISYVGTTDAAGYDARVNFQAGHMVGTTYTSTDFVISRNRGTGTRYIDAQCDQFNVTGTLYANDYVEFTPFFEGDGMAALRQVKGKNGLIDHDTTPEFAKRKVTKEDGEERDGRSLGAMVSILIAAVSQLEGRLEALEKGNKA